MPGTSKDMDLAGLSPEEIAVRATRRALAHTYLRGEGIEIGSGNRPVILPDGVKCHYGDKREVAALESYFGAGSSAETPVPTFMDAQTLNGVPTGKFDFVISAHVIEHLPDALGAINSALRVLKRGGLFMLILPDKRYTFDHRRPITPLSHLIADARDGGAGTILEAYREFGQYVHDWGADAPPEKVLTEKAQEWARTKADIHFHTWDADSFREMIDHLVWQKAANLIELISIMNENIAILSKPNPLPWFSKSWFRREAG
jgi:SAM-dependent methyltransferase